MVNRVLIRLKAVQLLYSYMLSRSEFKIETPVETSSADRRYSFRAYAELLLLLLELSGHKVTTTGAENPAVASAVGDSRFVGTQMARFLALNDDVRELMNDVGPAMTAYNDALPAIVARIKAIPAYRVLCKVKADKVTPADEIAYWADALKAMAKVPELTEAMRANPEFSTRGAEMGFRMLQETLSSYSDTRNLLVNCKKDLKRSLDQAYDLYHWLLWLPVEITRAEADRLDANASKYLPTEEDLHPDRRFAEEKLVDRIAANPSMQAYLSDHSINWHEDLGLIPALLDAILESEAYAEFMKEPGEKTVEEECELWRRLFKQVILPSDRLAEALENKSIFWNDDLEVMSSFAMKTLKRLAVNPEEDLQPEFKDNEDAEFGARLFDSVVSHREEYRAMIDEFINTKKWDTERVALMDIVILEAALAEALDFPNIPLNVTANEYVEIANRYSTRRSGAFVNGIFAAITDKLRREGRIIKKFNS